MKAIVYTEYGPPDVLRLAEVPKPAPKDNEVLIRIVATSLNALDRRMLRADPMFLRFSEGFFKPKKPILGADVAGHVEAVGSKTTLFKPGDEIFGEIGTNYGLGGLAEYACAPEHIFTRKPADVSFEAAAAVPMAGLTALQGLRDKGAIRKGQRVLIDGAAGGVGTFAIQLARYFGAEVTAVCSSRNLDQARTLGADHVIDYAKEDFTRNGTRYDLIFSANGYHPLSAYLHALVPGGRYVIAGGALGQILRILIGGPVISTVSGKTACTFVAHTNRQDLEFLGGLLSKGALTSAIEKRYPLEEAADALRYLETGHARGKLVISIA